MAAAPFGLFFFFYLTEARWCIVFRVVMKISTSPQSRLMMEFR